MVDIVVATNRASPYMAETLESVRRQTYPHWQLTVVDDGTPDPSAVSGVLKGFPRAVTVRQRPSGLPASRNRGVSAGDASLIAFLDDDDVWAPTKLEEQVLAMRAHPGAVASFTGGRYIDGEGVEFGEGWTGVTHPSEKFISGEVPAPRIVTLMVRRTVHAAIGGFNESFSQAEDNEYILRLAIHGTLVGVPKQLVDYRRHSNNMSRAGSLSGRLANRRVLRERLEAHASADDEIGLLLQMHLQRFEAKAAEECVGSLVHAARNRHFKRIVGELRWGVSAPKETGAAFVRALSRLRRH